MAYTKQNFANGSVLTAAQLNHIEDGLAPVAEHFTDNHGFVSGLACVASGFCSHAEGQGTRASDNGAHSEGDHAFAENEAAHAEGYFTTSSGLASHAEGIWTIANHMAQHVFGQYNIEDSNSSDADQAGTYVEIVGNGTGELSRSNARTLDWEGNESLAGSLTLGLGTANPVTITAAQLAQLLALLNN